MGRCIGGGLLSASNNLFADNQTSGDGGGALIANGLSGQVTFVNNTFVGNQAGDDGGGIYNNAAPNAGVVSSVFVQNDAAGSGGAIYQEGGAGSLTLSYSDRWQNSGPELTNVSLGTGNITADPLFIDSQYRLGRGSPALDIANPNTTLLVDFENDARPADQGYDMGYDELAGCRALRDGIPDPFGRFRKPWRLIPRPPNLLVQVTGICRGVNQFDIGGRQLVSQTVFITRSFTIEGGCGTTTLLPRTGVAVHLSDPEGRGRGFYISGLITPTITNISIINGNASGLGGGPAAEVAGGGIYNLNSEVDLFNVRV